MAQHQRPKKFSCRVNGFASGQTADLDELSEELGNTTLSDALSRLASPEVVMSVQGSSTARWHLSCGEETLRVDPNRLTVSEIAALFGDGANQQEVVAHVGETFRGGARPCP